MKGKAKEHSLRAFSRAWNHLQHFKAHVNRFLNFSIKDSASRRAKTCVRIQEKFR